MTRPMADKVDGKKLWLEQIPPGAIYYWHATPTELRRRTGPGRNDAVRLNGQAIPTDYQNTTDEGYIITSLSDQYVPVTQTDQAQLPKFLVLSQDASHRNNPWGQTGGFYNDFDAAVTDAKSRAASNPKMKFIVVQPLIATSIEVVVHELIKMNSDIYSIDE